MPFRARKWAVIGVWRRLTVRSPGQGAGAGRPRLSARARSTGLRWRARRIRGHRHLHPLPRRRSWQVQVQCVTTPAAPTMGLIVDRRADRLARGLLSLGLTTGDCVVVLCCDKHQTDRAVAYCSAQKADLAPIVLPAALPVESLRGRLRSLQPRLLLACSEGVIAWRQTGVACRVVGDEPGVTWWKLLEARHAVGREVSGVSSALLGG